MRMTKLNNGLTIVSQHNEQASSTMLCYWVKAGGHYESQHPYGTAHFLEHMLFKGTSLRTKEQISTDIELYGGRLGAATGTDRTRYVAYTPYDKWKQGVALLTDMMFHSTLPDDEIILEKKIVLEEIHRASDSPRDHGARTMMRLLRAMHPERASNLGTEETVSGLTRDDLRQFHDHYYRPSNIVLAATGHVQHNELVNYVSTLDIPEQPSVATELGKLQPYALSGEVVHISRDIRQAQLHWGMYGPDTYNDTKYAGIVALHILGSGQASRLWRDVRGDKGLAYDVSASIHPMISEGFITGFVATDPLQVGQVKAIIAAQLDRIRQEPLTALELERAQSAVTGRHLIAQDSTEAINANLAVQQLYGLNTDARYFAERIHGVTADEVLAFAQTYLAPERMLYVQVSREADMSVTSGSSLPAS